MKNRNNIITFRRTNGDHSNFSKKSIERTQLKDDFTIYEETRMKWEPFRSVSEKAPFRRL